jgi:hypothetical protein
MFKVAHYYLKSRIINISLDIPHLMIEMAAKPFSFFDSPDEFDDPLVYEQALFLSKFKICNLLQINSVQGAERRQLEIGLSRLQEFDDLNQFLKKCHSVYESAKNCNIKLVSDIMNSNLILTQEVSSIDYESI